MSEKVRTFQFLLSESFVRYTQYGLIRNSGPEKKGRLFPPEISVLKFFKARFLLAIRIFIFVRRVS